MVHAGANDASDGKDLVWIVARTGALSPLPLDLGPRALGAVWAAGGRATARFYTVYGSADGSAEALDETSLLVQACTEDAEAAGQVAAVVAGDFNQEWAELRHSAGHIAGGWADLSDEPTCATGRSAHARRIDLVLANREAQRRSGPVEVDWTTGLRTHAAQLFSFSLDRAPMVTRWRPPRPLDPLPPDAVPPAVAWRSAADAGDACLAECGRGCVDGAFQHLAQAMDQYAAARRGVDSITRGVGRTVRERREPRQHDGQSETALTSRLGRRARRLAELTRHWAPVGPPTFRGWRLLLALRRTETPRDPWCWRLSACHDGEVARQLADEAARQYQAARQEEFFNRRRRWRAWCVAAVREKPARLWRWLREGARPARLPPAVEHLPPESPNQEDAHVGRISDWWWRLWGSHAEPDWVRLDAYAGALDAFAPHPGATPWTAARLSRLIKVCGRKAPGADGQLASELKDWPPAMIGIVVECFNAVERERRWPTALRSALVAMLVRDGTGAPDDFRPIVLLPVLYRLWARHHSGAFRGWLRVNGVIRAPAQSDAAAQAYELAWALADARFGGTAVSGIAVGWSKCYDRVALRALPWLAGRLGIPPEFWRPVYSMYTAERRIIVGGSAGSLAQPRRGLPAGCPVAGDWLALLAHMLVSAVRRLGECHRPRPYVDDLTCTFTGPLQQHVPAVAAVWSTVRHFGATLGWEVSAAKCARFSTDPPTQVALAADPGPPVRTLVKDLGVIQHTGSRPAAATGADRDARATAKLCRAGALPLSFEWRGRAVASSGLPTALYGAASQGVPLRRLHGLRRAAFRAIWRSGRWASADVVFALHLPWRCDPLAHMAVQPWLQLAGALAAGTVQAHTVDLLWEASRDTVGPVAALRAAAAATGAAYLPGGRLQLGSATWELALTPRRPLAAALAMAHTQARLRALAERRRFFAPLADGVDVELTCALLRRSALKPDQAAALRVLQAGGSIRQQIASKWRGSANCPHCGLAEETLEHWLHHFLVVVLHLDWFKGHPIN